MRGAARRGSRCPTYGGRGTPLGVDVRKVVEHGITPKVTTGILHVSDGSGQIGAGVAEAPIGCFRDACSTSTPDSPADSVRLGQ